jgi:hypothetical protein
MKKNVLHYFLKATNTKLLIASLMWFVFQNVTAQVQNNGSLYIANNATLYVKSGDFVFGSGSTTQTTDGSNYGKLIFGADATFSGAATGAGLFVNGFASTRKSGLFTLPTGDGTTYAPIAVDNAAVDNASVTNGVDAIYNHTTNPTGLTTPLTAVLTTGKWIVKGDNAILQLSWTASISALASSLTDITVAGYNSGTSKWEEIASNAATGSLTTGSVTTTAAVNLSSYTDFTLAGKGSSCPPVFAGTGTKTWTGSDWSPAGNPSLNDAVTLNGNYPGTSTTAGSFECNSLAMGDYTITLTGQQSVEVVNDVTSGTNGKIIMSSETSFVQRKTDGTAPKIELTKTTRAIKRYDYVYWGSPVAENAFSQLAGAVATGQTTAGAFDIKYKYVSGISGANGAWQPLTAIELAKGFIMRVKQQAPFTNATTTGSINIKFAGTANNGTINAPVAVLGQPSARNNNLLANPYPSAIDADKFLTENTGKIDGVIYLWKANTENTTGGSNYTIADYVAYTKAGSTSTAYGGVGISGFNGKIASGQGFKVKALQATNVVFNNCMRVAGSNTQFLRTTNAYSASNDASKDRFKVNLQTAAGIANQILVAYLPETTLAYDYMYDAEILTVSPTRMYTVLDNDSKKLAINARPSFENTDQVAVGFIKPNTDLVQMSINVEDKQGVFANNQTPIYLHDTQLNIYHDFANGGYTFATTAQEDNNRFKIVYQPGQLNNEAFENNAAFATLNNQMLAVNASLPIKNVMVYDITGRLIMNEAVNSTTSFKVSFHQPQAVYIVKIGLENGQVVTTKLINQN